MIKPGHVAPHAGAWIETCWLPFYLTGLPSHPMRVRGLKHIKNMSDKPVIMSHPMRVRGLKRMGLLLCLLRVVVAPHAGAWIETH